MALTDWATGAHEPLYPALPGFGAMRLNAAVQPVALGVTESVVFPQHPKCGLSRESIMLRGGGPDVAQSSKPPRPPLLSSVNLCVGSEAAT